MLKVLREFRGDFGTISLSPNGTISVTSLPVAAKEPKPTEKRNQDTPKPRLTAIEALSKPTPVFEFETEN
jgi:hypothetical protein